MLLCHTGASALTHGADWSQTPPQPPCHPPRCPPAPAASRAVGLNAAPCLRRASCRPLGAGSGPWGPCAQAEGIGVWGLLPRPHNLCDVSCPVLAHPRFANCWELQGLKNEEHQLVGILGRVIARWGTKSHLGDRSPLLQSMAKPGEEIPPLKHPGGILFLKFAFTLKKAALRQRLQPTLNYSIHRSYRPWDPLREPPATRCTGKMPWVLLCQERAAPEPPLPRDAWSKARSSKLVRSQRVWPAELALSATTLTAAHRD